MAVTTNSPLRIAHPDPWITVSGEFNEATLTYLGTGVGSYKGIPNVSSRVQATFFRTGDSINTAELIVTFGENGGLPGRPVTYRIGITRR